MAPYEANLAPGISSVDPASERLNQSLKQHIKPQIKQQTKRQIKQRLNQRRTRQHLTDQYQTHQRR